jgi:arginyl-tRNA synthetase
MKHLDRFGETVEKAAAEFLPHHLALFLLELAQRFNLFYNQHPILDAETAKARRARLQLTSAVHDTLVQGLLLLGIETPETM